MNTKVAILKDKAEKARMMYRSGDIELREAKTQVTPYAEAVNSRSKELASKYGLKAQRFNLKAWLR